MRVGRVLLKITHLGELRKVPADVRKQVFASPLAIFFFQHLKITIFAFSHNESTRRVVLLIVKKKTKRLSRKSAESDIGQIFIITDIDDDRSMIVFRTVFGAVEDPRRNKPCLKANLSQQFNKQSIQLVAKSAALFAYDLGVKPLRVQNYRTLPMYVEVFKRHIKQMQAL